MESLRPLVAIFLSAVLTDGLAAAEVPILREGTPVRMRLGRTVSSSDANVGDTVDFETLDDVKVGSITLIPKGSSALGTVTEAVSKRRMARGGKLSINIDYVRLPNGGKLPLRGVQAGKGGGHVGAMTGAMVATAVVFFPAAPLFLFMHGKDMTIPKGHEVTVYTNTDYEITSSTLPTLGISAKPVPGVAEPPAPPAPPAEPPPGPPAPITVSSGAQFTSSAAALAQPANQPAPGTGDAKIRVHFTSDPAIAEVSIDGEYWGSTPIGGILMQPGAHVITFKKRGYQRWERKVTLVPGDTRTINAELEVEVKDPTKPKISGLDQR